MSLILEALSKARNDAARPTPDAQQQLAALTAPRHANRPAPRLSMVMGIATVIAITLLAALFILRPGPATATAANTEAHGQQSVGPAAPAPVAALPTPPVAPQDRPALLAVQPYLNKPVAPQPAAKAIEVPTTAPATTPTPAPIPAPPILAALTPAPVTPAPALAPIPVTAAPPAPVPAPIPSSPHPQPPTPAVAAPAPTPAAAPPAPAKPALIADAEYVETLDVQSTPILKLKAIVWSDYTKIALINNATVELDGSIAGVHVIDIEPKRIKLEFAGKQFFLRLP